MLSDCAIAAGECHREVVMIDLGIKTDYHISGRWGEIIHLTTADGDFVDDPH